MLQLLGRQNSNASPQSAPHAADTFLKFFGDKVQAVRSGTGHAPAPVIRRLTDATLSSLQFCSTDEVRRVIMESPTKSCALDPIPTFLLKECIDILLPFFTVMVNASLRDGSLPTSQKRAIVSPLLKKPSLDPSEMCNYRPVSNLTFVSMVVERVVASQLTRHLQSHDLMPRMQSAYRKYHSTETALLRVYCPTSMQQSMSAE